ATKWVSAVLIMDLVDDGLMSLDDKVSEWIPSFNTSDKKDITIRQCFSHTSGLPSSDLSLYHQEPPWTLEKSTNAIANRTMKEPPGTAFRYGGCSMQVAARVAELAGGDTWINLYQQRILEPLGITTLVWDNEYPDTRNPHIAGGIDQITVHDYAKLLQTILNSGTLNGVTILSPSSVETMLSDQTGGVPVAYSPYEEWEDEHPHLGYGIGCWVDRVDKNGKPVELSSQGAFGFSPWIDRNRNLAGVLLVYTSLEEFEPVYFQLRELVRKIVNEPPETPTLSGPDFGFTDTSYTFHARSVDPYNDSIYYKFDWGDGSNTSWLGPAYSGNYYGASHVWRNPGVYEVKVKAKDVYGLESEWSPVSSIEVVDKLVVNVNGPYNGVVGEPIQFNGSATGGYPPYSWHWEFGDGNTSLLQNPSHTYMESGVYTVTLSVMDNKGNVVNDSSTATVLEENTPPILTVSITKPGKAFYVFNKRVSPFFTPFIVGSVDVEVDVSSNLGLSHVEFYIDNSFKATDVTAPYVWTWSEKTFGQHDVRVVAYDVAGNQAEDSIVVWKFF
ncbi:MAG TPA: PKD domain-containing protein, partial [Thermoplasmatales archaeon]|nr:PKD domain-containing protein [Thermoplasmatales archaeon]